MREEPARLQKAYTVVTEFYNKQKDNLFCAAVSAGLLCLAALAPIGLYRAMKATDKGLNPRLQKIDREVSEISAAIDQKFDEIDDVFMTLEAYDAGIEGAEQVDREYEASLRRISEEVFARSRANNDYSRFRQKKNPSERGADALKVSRKLRDLVCKETESENN